jgi:hypothetical protein
MIQSYFCFADNLLLIALLREPGSLLLFLRCQPSINGFRLFG